jgi:hypothetical protein
MKIRSSPNVRIMAHVVAHYQHAVRQRVGDTGTMPAFGVSRDVRTVNVINVAGNGARKSRVMKSGVRRITYR